jgi:hypothetical protein
MFWGCFRGMAIMRLTDLPEDSESKRDGIMRHIILEFALKKILPQILDGYPKFIFMQNRVGIHKKKELVD